MGGAARAACGGGRARRAASRGGGWLGGGIAAIIAFLAVALPASRLFVPPLLVPAPWAVLGVGAAMRGRGVSSAGLTYGRERLRRWAEGTDAPTRNPRVALCDALDRRTVARPTVAVIVVVYAVGLLAVVAHMDFIGHADYADTAVRARNLVRGQGDTVDYVAQFYRAYPATITHPAETWPPLLVWMTALAFRFAGVSTVAAKLPNVVVMAGLLALVAGIGAWRWGRRVGAACRAPARQQPPIFRGRARARKRPRLHAAVCLLRRRPLYRVGRAEGMGSNREGRKARRKRRANTSSILSFLGAFGRPPAVFAIHSDGRADGGDGGAAGAGEAERGGAGCWRGGVAWLFAWRQGQRVPWGSVCVAGGVAALVYAPWAVRNFVTFGAPFHSTETLDAWVLKYDPKQPTEGIYRVFAPDALPHPRELVGYGLDHFLAVQGREFARFGAGLDGWRARAGADPRARRRRHHRRGGAAAGLRRAARGGIRAVHRLCAAVLAL